MKEHIMAIHHSRPFYGYPRITVALKKEGFCINPNGYDSPESFSKAFRKLHGISPSQTRKEGAPLPGSVQQTWDRIFSEWFPSPGTNMKKRRN
ncbi:hypothetical protein LWS67_20020 [Bacillus atrophaeus]|uniref:helix-turn-helix domain-containing protein n=1 Tax=Bacillus atrophaeus TaxID=1452 RepID=UPI00383432E3|nr:hypothetical protein [Bacillus atrophaeus]